ncbi:hypothetical protein P43SY_007404 [Pythium insidiosum]|uniref:Uncharacterized protein n=1 Tax=Pythium insidiosum TaxID=114742 RepID=A0AAD5Q5W0_PYTIN|nr:hypothetical protein P43SY_007404 [Pythium insidiosum]
MASATEIQGLTYRGDHASSWFLEASNSQVIPFTASHVNAITWKHFTTGQVSSRGGFRVLYHDNLMVKAKLGACMELGSSTLQVQGHFVSRRYVERERTVFVWGVRFVTTEGFRVDQGSSLALALQEDGWSITTPVEGSDCVVVHDVTRFRAVRPLSSARDQESPIDADAIAGLVHAAGSQFIAEWHERWERLLISSMAP